MVYILTYRFRMEHRWQLVLHSLVVVLGKHIRQLIHPVANQLFKAYSPNYPLAGFLSL